MFHCLQIQNLQKNGGGLDPNWKIPSRFLDLFFFEAVPKEKNIMISIKEILRTSKYEFVGLIRGKKISYGSNNYYGLWEMFEGYFTDKRT